MVFLKSIGGAVQVFTEATTNAHGSESERIFTDSLKPHGDGIRIAFNGQKPQQIANSGIKKPHATNNRIERMNGTLREKTKVLRRWKTMKTPIAEGLRIQFNFVKPHAALEGQTPAHDVPYFANLMFQARRHPLVAFCSSVN